MTDDSAKFPTVLVVEDDPSLAAQVVRGLKDAKMVVELATCGNQAEAAALKLQPDLIVLDLMLPGKDGFALLEAWRGRLSTPIIVLTARDELDDRLKCFELGAHDFLPKPFWIEELVARIRARLRLGEDVPRRVVSWGNATIDLDGRSVRVGGEETKLTPHEFNILAHLVERSGRAIARSQLAATALSLSGESHDRTVDSHVARIRRKLGKENAKAVMTVWGLGYRFSDGQSVDSSAQPKDSKSTSSDSTSSDSV
ncbi:MAG: response regulator transcription factor [Deltaproteobacteria bacterium]|nr:response regulator transcription factor [Deltaproteobacteria bacterium]